MTLTTDLFDETGQERAGKLGLTYLPGFALPFEQALLTGMDEITTAAPFRHMLTPGGQRMSVDRDERDFSSPIVSVSLGLEATFLFGGSRRSDRPRRLPLAHGDVLVWGGANRLNFHGVAPIADGCHPAVGRMRLNLTLRKAL